MNRRFRVFCNVKACVSCREYAGIPQSVRRFAANQGGTTDFYSSLTEHGSVGGFLFFLKEGLLWLCSQNDGDA